MPICNRQIEGWCDRTLYLFAALGVFHRRFGRLGGSGRRRRIGLCRFRFGSRQRRYQRQGLEFRHLGKHDVGAFLQLFLELAPMAADPAPRAPSRLPGASSH